MHIKTNKNITYKINFKTTTNDTRFDNHHLVTYYTKKHQLLSILFTKYLSLYTGSTNLDYDYKDILLYKRVDKRFPMCAIYLYQYIKKYYLNFDDVKLFIEFSCVVCFAFTITKSKFKLLLSVVCLDVKLLSLRDQIIKTSNFLVENT